MMYLYSNRWSRHLDQLVEPQVDLRLSAGPDLVVLGFDVQTALDHALHHLVADVHHLVRRRHREVAFLVPQLVAQIGLLVAATVPLALDAVQEVETLVRLLIEADIVEDEELRFRSEVGGVGDTRCLQ